MTDLSESRFTAASVECTNPQWWHSTDDHSTEIEVSELLAGLVRGLQPTFCIETGSAFGQTAEAIGKALLANGHGRLVSLEVDPERVAVSRQRCAGLPVEIIEQSSLEYTPAREVNFAFFDSLFPLRSEEFLIYRGWMRPGAIVAFHDTAPGHGGGQFPLGRDLRSHLDATLMGVVRLLHFDTPRGLSIGQVIR